MFSRRNMAEIFPIQSINQSIWYLKDICFTFSSNSILCQKFTGNDLELFKLNVYITVICLRICISKSLPIPFKKSSLKDESSVYSSKLNDYTVKNVFRT